MPQGRSFFKYGMKARGFSPGCQPKNGFIKRLDDPKKEYFDIIAYSRRLTDKEINDFELVDLNRAPTSKMSMYREFAGLTQMELSQESRVPYRTIQRLEATGIGPCSLEAAIRIADVIGVMNLRDLF